MQTIPEKFFGVAKRYPTKKALMFKEDQKYKAMTFSEFMDQVKFVATALQKLNIKKGDKVAIMSEGRPEWPIVDLASMAIGAIVVPIHTNLSSKIVNYIISHSEVKIVFTSKIEFLDKISQDELIFLENFVLMDNFNELKIQRNNLISWENFLKKGDVRNFTFAKNEADDICTIIYTSGTTGLPKGVMLSHKNILSNVEAVGEAVPVKKKDVFLSFLPLSHIFERTAGYYIPLLNGATIAYAENVKTLLKNLQEIKPTFLICVPRIFEKLSDGIWSNVENFSPLKKKLFYWSLKQKKGNFAYVIADRLVFKKIRKKMGGNLHLAISGGAALDERFARFFSKMGIKIFEGYGLTETSPVLAVNRESKVKFGTVGLPVSGMEIKISEDKEILARGPSIMKGYYKNETESTKAIDADGWFYTGDYGFIDKEGFLIIVGRKKEMIVTSGGKNVWPEHIEQELNFDKLVTQSLIVGHNRKYLSALIVPDRQELVTYLKSKNCIVENFEKFLNSEFVLEVFDKCIKKVNSNLSDFEQIKKFCLLPNEFSQEKDELTPTLKIRRQAIGHNYKNEIEKMYL